MSEEHCRGGSMRLEHLMLRDGRKRLRQLVPKLRWATVIKVFNDCASRNQRIAIHKRDLTKGKDGPNQIFPSDDAAAFNMPIRPFASSAAREGSKSNRGVNYQPTLPSLDVSLPDVGSL
jgi:hypothetical protein